MAAPNNSQEVLTPILLRSTTPGMFLHSIMEDTRLNDRFHASAGGERYMNILQVWPLII
jgi:hypothetical protein